MEDGEVRGGLSEGLREAKAGLEAYLHFYSPKTPPDWPWVTGHRPSRMRCNQMNSQKRGGGCQPALVDQFT